VRGMSTVPIIPFIPFLLPGVNFRKANAIGRSSKTVREFLERNYKDDMSRDETIKLTIKSLLEVVQTGAKNIEIAILEEGKPLEVCLS
jgi:20S proteasome subunit alpha 4